MGKSQAFLSVICCLLVVYNSFGVNNSQAPYPKSNVITKLTWEPSPVLKCGRDGSGDNWPITWVDDDTQITAFGDGDGFDRLYNPPAGGPDLSLGFARIFGDPPDFSGEDFATNADAPEGGGPKGIKASGLIMVDGILYMFVRNYKPPARQRRVLIGTQRCWANDFTNSRLAWSADYGAHWFWADWYFSDTFGCPEFIQFGKKYEGARDNYVYIVSQANDSAYGYSKDIVMIRVPRDKVRDRSQYEFFSRLDRNGRPMWSKNIQNCGPIFTDRMGVQRIAITYNAPLKRYILTTSHRPKGNDSTHTAALGIFDAPEPWGPWTTVYYNDHLSVNNAKDCRTYHHKFPTKWMSSDGKIMWLLFSGLDCNLYAFCVKKATLEINPRYKDIGERSLPDVGLSVNYVGPMNRLPPISLNIVSSRDYQK